LGDRELLGTQGEFVRGKLQARGKGRMDKRSEE